MADFEAMQGDRLPAITSTLYDDDGNPVDLTDATVVFRMRPLEDAAFTVEGPGEVVTPAEAGRVRYWWDADDLDDAGIFLASWRVTFADGRTQTYPGDRQLVVAVGPSLEAAATISPADLAWMREWVGSDPDDAALADRLAVYEGKRTLAVIGLLRMRRADLLSDPVSYSIRGDVTVNAGANLTALDGMIASLEAQAVADGDLEADDAELIRGASLERQDTWGRGWHQARIPS